VPMSVTARPATVTCTGGCTCQLNKKTDALIVTPEARATRVSVTVVGSAKGARNAETYAGHAWSRTWRVR